MQDLVERAKAGDRAAMEELLAAVAPAVRRFGMRMCRSDADADDVLQETLVAVATHIGDFEGRSALTSWLFSLARSACARRRRGLKNQPPVPSDGLPEHADEQPSPERRFESAELASVLTQALDRLPEDYREAILLRDMEGLTAPEAATALGISVDALKSRLHRARGALRSELAAVLEPPPAALGAGSPCPDVATMLSRKLEGELRPQDCADMERHVATCSSCAAACDGLKAALATCRRAAEGDVSPEIKARIRAALDVAMASRAR